MIIKKVTRHDEPRPVHLTSPVVQNGLPHILIRREVLLDMYDDATMGYPDEVAGFFVGLPLQDIVTGVPVTYIERAIRATTTASPTYVTMHPESFGDVASACEHSGTILVGYYHSHPGLSVFQSGTDIKNFELYHGESYKIAVVIDSTLTTQDHLDTTSPWIGFFAWGGDHTPVRLSADNIHLANERPALRQTKDTEPMPVSTELDVAIARGVWQASSGLAARAHRFDARLPIVVLSREVMDALIGSGESAAPREGLLMGVSGSVAGYDFACVTSRTPASFDTLSILEKAFRRGARKSAGMLGQKNGAAFTAPRDLHPNGANLVGLYGTASRLAHAYLIKRRLSRPFVATIVTIRDLARFCGKYCLMAVTGDEPTDAHAAELTIQFRVLCIDDRHVMVLPQSQIVILDAGRGSDGSV